MGKYKLALFDMDGTILDTLEDLTDATNVIMTQYGYPTHSIDAVRAFVGNGLRKLIERAVPNGTDAAKIDAMLADFKAYYADHCADKTHAYPGVPEMIARLRQRGIITAVVSNKVDEGVQELVKAYFPGLFDLAVGERPTVKPKPAPDMVFAALETLGIDIRDAVFIGDSDVDLKTAQNAGIDGIFVDWGFRTPEVLRALGAEIIVSTPEDVERLIAE
jgi:phosphoglycolate phosphatase